MYMQSVGASLTSEAAVPRRTGAMPSASLTGVAALVRRAVRAVAASTTPTAIVVRAVTRGIIASLTPAALVARALARLIGAGVSGAATVIRHAQRELGAAMSGTAALARAITALVVPNATVSNTGWTAVGAATIHAALAAGDADYATTSTNGAVTEVDLSSTPPGLVVSAIMLTVRARTG
jgi:hypothetical protein